MLKVLTTLEINKLSYLSHYKKRNDKKGAFYLLRNSKIATPATLHYKKELLKRYKKEAGAERLQSRSKPDRSKMQEMQPIKRPHH